jgi:hypothetical protein
MSKLNNLIYLLLFVAMFVFLACGNIAGTDPSSSFDDTPTLGPILPVLIDKFEITDFSFAKIKNSWYRDPITECIAGDTIGLICYVKNSSVGGYIHSDEQQPVIVRITSQKGKDAEYIKLVDDPYLGYITVFPNPAHQFIGYLPYEDMYSDMPPQFLVSNLPIKFTSKSEADNGILEISPDGDILTAEVQNNVSKHKVILNVKSK